MAARDAFVKIEDVKGQTDHPTNNLMEVMGETHFKKPNDWQGYRVLTEK